ncbi:MAG: phasin family protein [Neomegalonema sp.]|nr:phasin family protein [Neomegalonema sp.]
MSNKINRRGAAQPNIGNRNLSQPNLAHLPNLDFSRWVEINQRLFRANARLQADYLKHMSQMAEEMSRFADQRLSEDGATARQLQTCQNPGEILATCQKFWERASAQYASEISSLMALAMQQNIETTRDVQQQIHEAVTPVAEAMLGHPVDHETEQER